MIARWHALVAWLLAEEHGTSLALFRIALGLVVLVDLGDMYRSGAMTLLWMPMESGGLRNPEASGLLAMIVAPTTASIWSVYGAAMIAAAGLTLGLLSRLCSAVVLLSFLWLVSLFPSATGGHDRLISNALFVFAFARSDVTLSLRCWLADRRWRSATCISGWPRRVLVFQLVLMYVTTGINKLGVVWWPMGDFLAIHYALLLPHWARADWWWIAWLSPLTKLATLTTLIWETTWWMVPLWLWLRRTEARGGRLRRWASVLNVRRLYVVVGLLMHTSLWLMMSLGPFSAITLAYYFLLYAPDEQPGGLRHTDEESTPLQRRVGAMLQRP